MDEHSGSPVPGSGPAPRTKRLLDFLQDPSGLLTLLLVLCLLPLRVLEIDQVSAGTDFYTQGWIAPLAFQEFGFARPYASEVRRTIALFSLQKAMEPGATPRQKVAASLCHHPEPLTWGTSGTPLLLAALHGFSYLDYDTAYRWYQVLSLAAFTGGVVLMGRMLGYSVPALLALLTLFTFCVPWHSDLLVLNVNMLQVGLLVLSLYLIGNVGGRGGTFGGGAVLALTVLFKPNVLLALVLLVLAWAVNRRLRLLAWGGAGLLAGGVAGLALGSLYFGTPSIWLDFLRSLPSLLEETFPVEAGNYSLPCLLQAWTGVDVSGYLLAGFGLAAAAVLWVRRRRPRADAPGADRTAAERRAVRAESCLAVALGVGIGLVTSRLVWLHYFLLAVPLIIYLLRPEAVGSERGQWGLAAKRAGVGLALLLTTRWIYGLLPFSPPLLLKASACILSVLILVGLGYWSLWRLGAGEPAAPAPASSA